MSNLRSGKRKRPESAQLSDWFRRAQDGENDALQQLLAVYRPLLLRLADNHITPALRPKVGPSDLVQSAEWNATQGFPHTNFENRHGFVAWLVKILANEAVDMRRRFLHTKKRDVAREQPLHSRQTLHWLEQLSASLSNSGPQNSWYAGHLEQLQFAMERLPKHYQLVLKLRYAEKQSFAAIAEKLDRSYDGVRMLAKRALARLEVELKRLQSRSPSDS